MKYSIILLIIFQVYNLNNGVGITPPMGWNSWNFYGCQINQQIIKTIADNLVSTGLAAKGYKYINIDDCWQIDRNSSTNQLIPDMNKFPNGISSLSKYIHQKGLMLGLYSDAGIQSCSGKPGSLGFQTVDALTFAKWEIDYLKYDNCFKNQTSAKIRYPVMRDALNKTGRRIFYAMCNWGEQNPEIWAAPVANSWRTTGDMRDNWQSFTYILDQQEGFEKYSGPGAWNDLDILQIGNGGMTLVQYQSYFALWALLKSPLIISCDLRSISKDILNIIGNQQIIAINQDKLGIQASRVKQQVYAAGTKDYYAGRISGQRYVIGLFNRQSKQTDFSFSLVEDLKLSKGLFVTIRDIINHKQLGIFHSDILTFKNVQSHGIMVLIISLIPSRSLNISEI